MAIAFDQGSESKSISVMLAPVICPTTQTISSNTANACLPFYIPLTCRWQTLPITTIRFWKPHWDQVTYPNEKVASRWDSNNGQAPIDKNKKHGPNECKWESITKRHLRSPTHNIIRIPHDILRSSYANEQIGVFLTLTSPQLCIFHVYFPIASFRYQSCRESTATKTPGADL